MPQGMTVNAVTSDWALRVTVTAFARFLSERSSRDAALFLSAATNDWDPDPVLKLVAHLATSLRWDDHYLRYFQQIKHI